MPEQLRDFAPERWALAAGWQPVVAGFFSSAQGAALTDFLRTRLKAGATIYPSLPLRALELTALHAVDIVILGQDPYHGPGQAEGLAFSVAPGVRLPPSLRNIFKERQRDLGLPAPAHGSLLEWARDGVLLLNTCLTVEDGHPASHARRGWEVLADALLSAVAARGRPCVYMLWGAHAQARRGLIEAARPPDAPSLVLQSNHPSPLSAARAPAPFLGCGHFGAAQRWLAAQGGAGGASGSSNRAIFRGSPEGCPSG